MHKKEKEEKGYYTGKRIEEQITSHYTCNSPTCPHDGQLGRRVYEKLRQPGNQTAEEVKYEIAEVSYSIFYIVSEYPKIEHVSDKVEPPTVEKHKGYHGQNHSAQKIFTKQLGMKKSGWYNPIAAYKVLQVCP